MLKNTVEFLGKSYGKTTESCGLNVQKPGLMNNPFFKKTTYEQSMHMFCTLFVNKLTAPFQSVKSDLYTLSTMPITTIYLNKGVSI